MNESTLMIKSKEFALSVIKVCKELRTVKCESALINQFCVPALLLEQILERLFMHTEKLISLRNFRSHLKNAAKASIG